MGFSNELLHTIQQTVYVVYEQAFAIFQKHLQAGG